MLWKAQSHIVKLISQSFLFKIAFKMRAFAAQNVQMVLVAFSIIVVGYCLIIVEAPYGCRKGIGSKCVACLSDFNLNAQTHKCEGGTSALVSNNSLATNPQINLGLDGQSAWGFRTYLMLIPSHDRASSSVMSLFRFHSNNTVSSVQVAYHNHINPKSVNLLSILFNFHTQFQTLNTSAMHIPLGQWLSVSLFKSELNQLKFSVNQYGSSSISAVLSPPTALELDLNSQHLIVHLKDMRLWRGAGTEFNMAAQPLCEQVGIYSRFSSTISSNEYARFMMDFSPSSSVSELIDSEGTLTTVQLEIKDSLTPGDLISTYQPITQLKSNYFHSQSHSTPTCSQCVPHCSKCSDLFTCTECEEGTLLNGICISSRPNVQEGAVFLTNFELKSCDFSIMNEHAQSVLRLPSQTTVIEFNGASLKYPDNSVLTIPDSSSFQVPEFRQSNRISFEAQVIIHYTVNQRYFSEPIASLSLSQDLYTSAQTLITAIRAHKLESLSSNGCGCSVKGKCIEELSICRCETGYGGHFCQFEQRVLEEQQAQITVKVEHLYYSLGMLSDSTILNDLTTISSEADVIADQTAVTIIYIVEKILQPATSSDIFNRGFQILSNLLICARYEGTTMLIIGQSIKEAIDEVLEHAVQQKRILMVTSSRIIAKAAPLDYTISHHYYPSQDPHLYIEIPAHFIDIEGEAWFVSVLYKERLYATKAPARSIQASDVLKLDIYNDKGQFHIHDIAEPIVLHYPVDRNSPVLAKNIHEIAEGTKPLSHFNCYYYDQKFREPSTRGCELRDLTQQEMVCACTHMTDFVNFLQTAPEVVTQSNYSVFYALTEMDAVSLKTNTGVYLAMAYWISFLVLFFIVQDLDRRIMKSSFYDKLYSFLNSLLASTEDSNEHSPVVPISTFNERQRLQIRKAQSIVPQNIDPMTRSRRSRKTVTTFKIHEEPEQQVDSNIQLHNMERYSMGSDRALQSSPLDRMRGESFADYTQRQKNRTSLFERLKKTKKSPFSWIKQIKRRIDAIVDQEKAKRRNCCCLFQRLARNELATNNLIFNLISRTSPLTKRAARLTLLYMSILLDITVCALFFDLTHSEPPQHVWDYIGQILWIGFYTVLITMLPTFILGALFSPPKSFLVALQNAQGKQDLMREYKRVSRRLKCRLLSAITFFFLLSHFLLLYLICFCHIASDTMVYDWGLSALVAIMIDQVAFEIVPSFIVGFFGVLRAYCCKCSGMSCILILVEVYRLYRNVV